MRLSVLDRSPIISGRAAADAIAVFLDLVQAADAMAILTVAPDYAACLRSHKPLPATPTVTAVA